MLVLIVPGRRGPYAVASARVVEVVPRVEPRGPCPTPRRYLAGLLRYRGRVVPVIDLGLLDGRRRLPRTGSSTRIILVDGGVHGGNGLGFLGLIAERVNDVRRVDERSGPSPAWRSRRPLSRAGLEPTTA